MNDREAYAFGYGFGRGAGFRVVLATDGRWENMCQYQTLSRYI